MEPPSLRAGQVAARAGVHRETLRYYERRRLIPAPPRRLSGYRAYPVETVERVRLIKWAQGLGFRCARSASLLAFPAITYMGVPGTCAPAPAARSTRSTRRSAGFVRCGASCAPSSGADAMATVPSWPAR